MESANLITVAPGNLRLAGLLGKGIDITTANRLKKVDYARLVDVFGNHTDDDGGWRGEFWGKIIRSTILAWQITRDEELLEMLLKGDTDPARFGSALIRQIRSRELFPVFSGAALTGLGVKEFLDSMCGISKLHTRKIGHCTM